MWKIIEKKALTKIQTVIVAVIVVIAAVGGGVAGWYISQPREVVPIKFGLCHPITGYSMLIGSYARKGAILATEEINKKGGILGRPIELFIVDDKGDPAQGVTAMNRLIAVDQVDVILGPGFSSVVLATMSIVQKEKVPTIIFCATNAKISELSGVGGNEWTFRVNPHDALMGPAFAKVLIPEHNISSISLIALNNDFGRGNVAVWQNLTLQYNVNLLSVDYFDYGETNFLPLLTNIKALNPDCLFIFGDYEEGYQIMKVYYELGMTQLVAGRGGVSTVKFAEKFGNQIAEGITGINFYSVDIANSLHKEFLVNFAARWGEMPDIEAAWCYVSTYVLAEAITKAGKTDKTAVRNALKSISMDTMLGHIEFDDHNQAYCPIYIYSIHAGKEQLIATVETSPP